MRAERLRERCALLLGGMEGLLGAGGRLRRVAASAACDEYEDPAVVVERTSWEVDRSRMRPSRSKDVVRSLEDQAGS